MKNDRFVINNAVDIEETRHYELKEVKGDHPIDVIKNACDEYVVAFLNSDGGRIYWGVRDSDRTAIGVLLDAGERDRLRRLVTEKLNQIKPPISPSAYQIHLHTVYEDESAADAIKDRFVVEVVAPTPSRPEDLYATGGDEVFYPNG